MNEEHICECDGLDKTHFAEAFGRDEYVPAAFWSSDHVRSENDMVFRVSWVWCA